MDSISLHLCQIREAFEELSLSMLCWIEHATRIIGSLKTNYHTNWIESVRNLFRLWIAYGKTKADNGQWMKNMKNNRIMHRQFFSVRRTLWKIVKTRKNEKRNENSEYLTLQRHSNYKFSLFLEHEKSSGERERRKEKMKTFSNDFSFRR